MRVAPRMVLLVLLAGALVLSAALALDRFLETRAGWEAPDRIPYAAGAGLAALLLAAVIAAAAGRAADRQRAVLVEQLDAELEVLEGLVRDLRAREAAAAADPPAPGPPLDLGRLAAVLSSELKGPPGPVMRRFRHFARPPAHRPAAVSVNAAVEVCVRAMRLPGGGDGLNLSFDPDPNVRQAVLDPDSFHQMLLNLIQNAREAAGPAGHVDIRTQAMDDMVLVAVRDDGPGVALEDMERIFEPFYSTKRGSLGLGLAICRRVAAAHGGSIAATNIHPHGLEVGVRLPAGRASYQ